MSGNRIEEAVREAARRHGAAGLFLLTDSHVDSLTRGLLTDVPRLVVEPGEESKSLETARMVWDFLEARRAVRRSVLVNLGGGMISDLGGFAAAVFKRGIASINLPTTLLAAVDAAIGGKTGVNYAGLKNELGVFAMPLAVFPVTSLFGSLSHEEWLSGVGEALKTGLLDSEELFSLASSPAFIVERDPAVVDEVVARCMAFKSRVVEADFRETGLRRILNLGHTAAHAFEALALRRGSCIPHGIAVAHGLRVALEKSCREAGLPEEVLHRYAEVLKKYFPPLPFAEDDAGELLELMAHDKKNLSPSAISWVLLRRIGSPL